MPPNEDENKPQLAENITKQACPFLNTAQRPRVSVTTVHIRAARLAHLLCVMWFFSKHRRHIDSSPPALQPFVRVEFWDLAVRL